MKRKNWYWDINIPYSKIKQILRREDDPRFARIAGTLLARVDDPEQVFKLVFPAAFCRRWRAIRREITSDAWTAERAALWEATYLRLSKELSAKGEKVRQPAVLRLDDFDRDLISRIRKLRKNALMTQAELARFAGCSQQYISGIEKGREKVTIDFLKRLAEVTNQIVEIAFLPRKMT